MKIILFNWGVLYDIWYVKQLQLLRKSLQCSYSVEVNSYSELYVVAKNHNILVIGCIVSFIQIHKLCWFSNVKKASLKENVTFIFKYIFVKEGIKQMFLRPPILQIIYHFSREHKILRPMIALVYRNIGILEIT